MVRRKVIGAILAAGFLSSGALPGEGSAVELPGDIVAIAALTDGGAGTQNAAVASVGGVLARAAAHVFTERSDEVQAPAAAAAFGGVYGAAARLDLSFFPGSEKPQRHGMPYGASLLLAAGAIGIAARRRR